MNEQDPLADLLLDADEVDRARLAEGLRGLIGIDSGSGRIVLKPSYSALTSRQKVLAYLLGRKAAYLLDKADVEAIAPKDIAADTGMPSGTVNPKLKELKDARLVSQTDESEYYVESYQILNAIEELRSEK